MNKEPRRRSIGPARNPASAEAILNAADQVLIDRGLKGFTIDEVAQRAKAGKPTIYRWWPTKAVLLLDVYLRQKSIVFQNTGKFEDDRVAFIDAILTSWRETASGPVFRSIIAEAQSDEKSREALTKFAKDRREETAFLVLEGLRRGELRDSINPVKVARWIGAYLWYQLLTDRLSLTVDEIRDDMEILLVGLAKE